MSAKESKALLILADTMDPAGAMKEAGLTKDEFKEALTKAAGLLASEETEPGEGGRYVIYTDGAARGNPGPSGAGFVIYRDDKMLEGQARYLGEITNNQAEYNALILALERVLELGADEVVARSDSELMVRQLNGQYKVKDSKLKGLFARAKELIGKLDTFEIEHIRREYNSRADAMANRAIDEFGGGN